MAVPATHRRWRMVRASRGWTLRMRAASSTDSECCSLRAVAAASTISGGAADAGIMAENRARPAQSCDVHPEIPTVRSMPSSSTLQNEGSPESMRSTLTSLTRGNRS